MRITDVKTADELRGFMTTPSDGLVELMGQLEGDVLVLGAGGKMGGELIETIQRADRQAGARRRLMAADLFGRPGACVRLEESGVETHAGDLADRQFLLTLPDAPNVFYMAGVKFGSSRDWRLTFHLNCIVPYLVGERFTDSSIVVFSSGNPYRPVPVSAEPPQEDGELDPQGVYGWTIVGREAAFRTTALRWPGQRVCLFRLMYAQHLAYGVLVDLAQMVWRGEPISLRVPAVNLVSQRDAIDVAVRALGQCANPPLVLNCAGPAVTVREIARKLGEHMGKEPVLRGPEGETALLAGDKQAVELFGPHRDGVEEMIEAAARWVIAGGENWASPTMFGRLRGSY